MKSEKLTRNERDNIVGGILCNALAYEYRFAVDEHGPYERIPQAYDALHDEVNEARDEMLRVDLLTSKVEAAVYGFISDDNLAVNLADMRETAIRGAHELIQVAAVTRKFFDLLMEVRPE